MILPGSAYPYSPLSNLLVGPFPKFGITTVRSCHTKQLPLCDPPYATVGSEAPNPPPFLAASISIPVAAETVVAIYSSRLQLEKTKTKKKGDIRENLKKKGKDYKKGKGNRN